VQAELAVCATTACSRGRRSLSNDVPVNDVERSEDVNGTSPNGSGVLANLPRSRPQRSSARRLAARESTSAHNGSGTARREPRKTPSARSAAPAKETRKPARGLARKATKRTVAPVGESAASASAKRSAAGPAAKASAPKARSAKRPTAPRATQRRARPAAALEPAPRQGFESESELPSGSVQPPGGVELVASAAELVGELAKAGLSKSERLLKDVVSRLPL
jgi:hypothetical protein